MIRNVVRRLSNGVVLKRHLPREFGAAPLLVSPECALGYWRYNLKHVDPFLLSMVSELVRPGMVVWDVGANSGLFSFAAAGIGARVVAIEPDTWLANLLHRSVLMNRLPVIVLAAAASDASGISALHLSEHGRASNSLQGSGPPQDTVTITLDWLLEHSPTPQLVKIDVEGCEAAVLRGATKLLRTRPIVFCEVTRHHDDVAYLLGAAGYALYAAREADRHPLQRPSYDTLAVPREVPVPRGV
jgi:FkbM family methyltransferase